MSNYIDPNKKKIRGWNKKIRQIDLWFDRSKNLDVGHLQKYREDYVKIQINPWNRLVKRAPPNWYYKLILVKLIEIHDLWIQNEALKDHPHDLQLWLHEPNTIRSEVVCPLVGKEGGRRDNYYLKSNDFKQFPFEKWSSKKVDLHRFTWELYDDHDFVFESHYELSEEEIDELFNEGYIKEEIEVDGKNDVRYKKKVGNVWIGRFKR
jgi:hypothetical protein